MSTRGSRRSDNDLAYGDDYGGERWDRQRFERVRAKSRGPPAQDTVRVEEFDRYPDRRDIRVEVDEARRGPRGRYQETDVVVEEEASSPPRRRRPQPREEERSREVAAYRPREKWDRDYEMPSRKPARPMYGRRQSSLDTHDRRPLPRYSEEEERDIKISVNVMPPPEPRYRDLEYRYKPPNNYREDPRDLRIRREVEREVIRNPERAENIEESSDSFEDPGMQRRPKRGKTRMPKRLVHRAALIQLGYQFDEEEDFYIVRQALVKERIDEVIKISETYFNDNKVVYKFQDTKLLEAPPPPRAPTIVDTREEPPVEIIETITTKIIENPTPEDYVVAHEGGRPQRRSVYSPGSSRSVSPAAPPPNRTVVAELRADASEPIVIRPRSKSVAKPSRVRSTSSASEGESALVVSSSRRKSTRNPQDIKAEIRALEAEQRRMETQDRGGRRESEAVEAPESRDRSATIVRVEKDKRGRLALVRPAR